MIVTGISDKCRLLYTEDGGTVFSAKSEPTSQLTRCYTAEDFQHSLYIFTVKIRLHLPHIAIGHCAELSRDYCTVASTEFHELQ
jgi:hypothetical protein